jgi:hypothetical protein
MQKSRNEKWHTTGFKCRLGPMSALGHKRTLPSSHVRRAFTRFVDPPEVLEIFGFG